MTAAVRGPRVGGGILIGPEMSVIPDLEARRRKREAYGRELRRKISGISAPAVPGPSKNAKATSNGADDGIDSPPPSPRSVLLDQLISVGESAVTPRRKTTNFLQNVRSRQPLRHAVRRSAPVYAPSNNSSHGDNVRTRRDSNDTYDFNPAALPSSARGNNFRESRQQRQTSFGSGIASNYFEDSSTRKKDGKPSSKEKDRPPPQRKLVNDPAALLQPVIVLKNIVASSPSPNVVKASKFQDEKRSGKVGRPRKSDGSSEKMPRKGRRPRKHVSDDSSVSGGAKTHESPGSPSPRRSTRVRPNENSPGSLRSARRAHRSSLGRTTNSSSAVSAGGPTVGNAESEEEGTCLRSKTGASVDLVSSLRSRSKNEESPHAIAAASFDPSSPNRRTRSASSKPKSPGKRTSSVVSSKSPVAVNVEKSKRLQKKARGATDVSLRSNEQRRSESLDSKSSTSTEMSESCSTKDPTYSPSGAARMHVKDATKSTVETRGNSSDGFNAELPKQRASVKSPGKHADANAAKSPSRSARSAEASTTVEKPGKKAAHSLRSKTGGATDFSSPQKSPQEALDRGLPSRKGLEKWLTRRQETESGSKVKSPGKRPSNVASPKSPTTKNPGTKKRLRKKVEKTPRISLRSDMQQIGESTDSESSASSDVSESSGTDHSIRPSRKLTSPSDGASKSTVETRKSIVGTKGESKKTSNVEPRADAVDVFKAPLPKQPRMMLLLKDRNDKRTASPSSTTKIDKHAVTSKNILPGDLRRRVQPKSYAYPLRKTKRTEAQNGEINNRGSDHKVRASYRRKRCSNVSSDQSSSDGEGRASRSRKRLKKDQVIRNRSRSVSSSSEEETGSKEGENLSKTRSENVSDQRNSAKPVPVRVLKLRYSTNPHKEGPDVSVELAPNIRGTVMRQNSGKLKVAPRPRELSPSILENVAEIPHRRQEASQDEADESLTATSPKASGQHSQGETSKKSRDFLCPEWMKKQDLAFEAAKNSLNQSAQAGTPFKTAVSSLLHNSETWSEPLPASLELLCKKLDIMGLNRHKQFLLYDLRRLLLKEKEGEL